MLEIIGSSDWQHRVRDGEVLPPLEQRLGVSGKERFRRVDRFTALALVGSAECVANRSLAPDCGLYIGSGTGPMGSNVRVQKRIGVDRELPTPFDFINTLGSAVGHYVAKSLGVCGQTLFISRRRESFQAALSIAAVDLTLGLVPQALVGVVEECPLPLVDHRRRIGADHDSAVGEGTHWLLLQRAAGNRGHVPLAVERFEARASVERRLESTRTGHRQLVCSERMTAGERNGWLDAFGGSASGTPASIAVPWLHDSHDAAVMTDWLQRKAAGKLGLLCGDDRTSWLYLELGA